MLTKARAGEIVSEAEARKLIARVLRTGTIEREPRWSGARGNYEVRVRGRSYDDRDTRVVVGITDRGSVVFVTIVHIGRGR